MLIYLKQKIIDIAGAIIGYLEMIGFKYPVKAYRFKVSESLWRGSRLDNKAIGDLKVQGFKLIVNLCAENNNDYKPAALYGIKALHIPIMDNQSPKEFQVMEFLTTVGNPINQPVYVHCEAGKGRTGVMIACYRIVAQKWTVEAALAEAKTFGLGMPNQNEFIQEFARDWKAGIIPLKKFF